MKLGWGAMLAVLFASGVVQAKENYPSAEDRARIEANRHKPYPPLSVEDVISLTTFGGGETEGQDPGTIAVSPDGRQAAVVTQRGDVARNTREYSLLVLRSQGSKWSAPVVVARFATSSNRPGIARVRWLRDNATVVFIGERSGETSQVYAADIRSQRIEPLTRSATAISAYTTTQDGKVVVYLPEAPRPDPSQYAAMRDRGFVVDPRIPLFNLISGDWLQPYGNPSRSVHVVRAGQDTGFPLPTTVLEASVHACRGGVTETVLGPTLVVSPQGDRVLIRCRIGGPFPAGWTDYTLKAFAHGKLMALAEIWIAADLNSGQMRPLLNAPTLSKTLPEWSADGATVRLIDELLPLEKTDEQTQLIRREHTFDAEVDVRTGAFKVLNPGPARKAVSRQQPKLAIRQGMNEPWVLAAQDTVVFNPNPSLSTTRKLAHVTALRWQTKAGAEYEAALYWPVDYERGKRYPLVFQTRGVDLERFAPSGLSTTGHAAQPLAGSGIMVLQGMKCVQHCEDPHDTPERAYPRYQEQVEGGIDRLAQLGLIDTNKVGLQGWSMSCMTVMQMLTRSSYPIAAASGSDCRTDDYFIHLIQAPLWRANTNWFARMKNAGEPFGPSLRKWMENAPGFNLDKVQAPLQLVALGPEWFQGVLSEWEHYMGLVLQDKPVELVYIPDAVHGIVKPWERVTSQQGAVDWYRFWLQGEERTEPIIAAGETSEDLAAQYQRWRKLRAMQLQDIPTS